MAKSKVARFFVPPCRSVGYTTDCKGEGLEVCDVILGVQSSVMKRGKGRRRVIFSLKLRDVIYG